MILSSVKFEESVCLFVWDFRSEKKWDRWFVKRRLRSPNSSKAQSRASQCVDKGNTKVTREPPGTEFWLVYDVMIDEEYFDKR